MLRESCVAIGERLHYKPTVELRREELAGVRLQHAHYVRVGHAVYAPQPPREASAQELVTRACRRFRSFCIAFEACRAAARTPDW